MVFIDVPVRGVTDNSPGIGAPFVVTVIEADEDTPESNVETNINVSVALDGNTKGGSDR